MARRIPEASLPEPILSLNLIDGDSYAEDCGRLRLEKLAIPNPRKQPEYHPAYPEYLIRHMSRGYSFDSFAGVVGVSTAELKQWCRNYRALEHARQMGDAARLQYWEQFGMQLIRSGRGGSAAIWLRCMESQFDWGRVEAANDWQESKYKHMSDAELLQEISSIGKTLEAARAETPEEVLL